MATCFIRAVVGRWCLNPKGLGSNPSGSKIAFSHLISAAGPKKRITGPGPHRPAGSGMWAWSPSVRLTGVRSSGPGHGFDGLGRRDRSRATCMLGLLGLAMYGCWACDRLARLCGLLGLGLPNLWLGGYVHLWLLACTGYSLSKRKP
ncbi:hypothetical protein M0R45_027057 [Rubus argutus]|uniref:Uncharacterized protein n=1 Tax=Rubus argutus TaxID=59490 RepID=A0AAW1X1X4_RUBAR